MRSLLVKAQEEINTTTNTWEAEADVEEEAGPTFTALLSSAGFSLHSVLSTTTAQDDPLHPNAMSPSSSLMPLPFSEFAQDTLITTTPTHSPTTTFNLTTTAADYIHTQAQNPILRLPKHEPISNYQDYFPIPSPTNTDVSTSPPFHHLHQQQYQFYNPPDIKSEFTMASASIAISNPIHHPPPYDYMNDCSSVFHHLPDLLPLDPFNSPYSSSSSSSSYRRPRLFDPPHFQNLHLFSPLPLFPPNNNTHNALLPSSYSSPYKIPAKPRPRKTVIPSPSPHANSLARDRRQKLSDKTRCLGKLLPSDRKMDIATVFEEAYKYIKFLQAQVTALQAMPIVTPNTSASSTSAAASATGFDDDHLSPTSSRTTGGLERLSRNQLLQVLLNSSVAQTIMYSQGCCVFSVEQLAKLNRSRSTRALNLVRHYYPHIFDSHSPTN